MKSALTNCLVISKDLSEWGRIFDSLRNEKKERRYRDLNTIRNSKALHACTIRLTV